MLSVVIKFQDLPYHINLGLYPETEGAEGEGWKEEAGPTKQLSVSPFH